MILVLSAATKIERENIRVKTMEGHIQKARDGKWNGSFYKLVNEMLAINESKAKAIRTIFDQYVNTGMRANGIAKYLEEHGIYKIARQNADTKNIKNPVYCGKLAYGCRKTEKVYGTRNDYHLVEQDDYIVVDGLNEAIVSDEVWQDAQIKLRSQSQKYEHIHLISGIVKCPICGEGMYGNNSIKKNKDGTQYKNFYCYGCKHRKMNRGHKCEYKSHCIYFRQRD